MPWLIAACVAMVLGGIWLYSQNEAPEKRRVAYALIAAPIVLMGLLLVISHFSGGGGLLAGSRLDPQSVELGEPAMNEAAGAGYTFTARVYNRSADRELDALDVQINALDCVPSITEGSKENCSVIAEQVLAIRVSIPGGQARDVKRSVIFGRSRPQAKGELRWAFGVLAASAR